MSNSPGFLTRLAGAVSGVISAVAAAWFLALTRSALPSGVAVVVAGIFVLVVGVIFWRWRTRVGLLVVLPAILLLGISAIYLGTSPRNDRAWRPDDRQMAWSEIAGDVATIHNFRNFDWTSASTAQERWETRAVHLSNLRGVDFIMVHWEGFDNICHTMLSFDFGPDGFVCASVDARLEAGETYSPVSGAFRAYELLYVFGDERDVVRLRTNFRKDQVNLFRFNITPETARELFVGYLNRANALRDQPEWYNSLTTNCTTTIRYHAKLLGIENRWNWEVLANGHLDSFFHQRGRFVSGLSLSELRERGAITAAAQAAPLADFSTAIRARLPVP
ncbi:MAG TPA: DUF4105 domain-containing protein [Candidatus Didemnitutus sp.]|nr:DUF4105 domain-containing protein [Candidatus Didemnitutus sp.]